MCGVCTKNVAGVWGKEGLNFSYDVLLKASKCTYYVKIYKNYGFKKQCQEKQNLTFHGHFLDSVGIEMTRLCGRNMNVLFKNYVMRRWYKVYNLLSNSCDGY